MRDWRLRMSLEKTEVQDTFKTRQRQEKMERTVVHG